jgi:hypothetical protein
VKGRHGLGGPASTALEPELELELPPDVALAVEDAPPLPVLPVPVVVADVVDVEAEVVVPPEVPLRLCAEPVLLLEVETEVEPGVALHAAAPSVTSSSQRLQDRVIELEV